MYLLRLGGKGAAGDVGLTRNDQRTHARSVDADRAEDEKLRAEVPESNGKCGLSQDVDA